MAIEPVEPPALRRAPTVTIPRRSDALPAPLSFAQERLWFLERLQPERAVYNLSTALTLEGVLDERALECALGRITRRHETLRTTFAEVDGVPVQVIAPWAGFTLPRVDL